MANLARFNPFRSLARIDPFPRDVDEFFKSLWPASHTWEKLGEQIPVDVTESKESYKVRAEIPGISKDEIKVSVLGEQVTISVEACKEKEEKKDEQVITRECYYGRQYRSFLLPQEVDTTGASARYSDGVLELVLPKKEGGTQMSNIEVQ